MLKIEDISRNNIDDVFKICSYDRIFAPKDDPILKEGREIKRSWLLDMLEKYGSCTKIAYLDGKPVAQTLFYPEETAPYLHNPRKDVINLQCILNSIPQARGKGVGTALIKALLNDAHMGLECMGGNPCRFIVTRPYPHEGDLSITDFNEKFGFKQGNQEMFLEIKEKYNPRKFPELKSLPEDKDQTIIVYNPNCEWGYYLAMTLREIFQNEYPNYPVEVFDSWKEPEEYKKRGGGWMLIAAGMLVNNKVPENPYSFWFDRKTFIQNLEKAMKN